MISKRSARIALLACASVASLGLLAGASPAAAAKKKAKVVTKTAALNQCVSTSQRVAENEDPPPVDTTGGVGSVAFPVTVPKFRGKPQDGQVTALTSAGVRITHTFDGDLNIVLVSPGGGVVPLAITRGESADGYGSGATNCGGSLVLFGDVFPTSISTVDTTGNTPLTGSFKPERPLSALVGSPARGNWVVLVTDGAGGDTGTLDAVSLNLTYQYKALKKVKKKK
jgi:subtilisin-like proprotein convertase family protein